MRLISLSCLHLQGINCLSTVPFEAQQGPFSLAQAISLDALAQVAEAEGAAALDQFLLDPELAVDHLPRVEVTDSAAFYLKQGQAVVVRNAPLNGMVRVAEAGGPFLGIGEMLDDGRVAPKRLFVDSH